MPSVTAFRPGPGAWPFPAGLLRGRCVALVWTCVDLDSQCCSCVCVCVCVLVFVLWSVLFVLFMVPMFVIKAGVGTEIVGVHALCLLVVRFMLVVVVPVAGEALASSVLRSPKLSPQQCLPNSAGWPVGPSAPLCVLLNTMMVCCQESWCCKIWFCFMSVSQGTSCLSFTGPLSFWPLYG